MQLKGIGIGWKMEFAKNCRFHFYAQGGVRKFAAMQHTPRAAGREDKSSQSDYV